MGSMTLLAKLSSGGKLEEGKRPTDRPAVFSFIESVFDAIIHSSFRHFSPEKTLQVVMVWLPRHIKSYIILYPVSKSSSSGWGERKRDRLEIIIRVEGADVRN